MLYELDTSLHSAGPKPIPGAQAQGNRHIPNSRKVGMALGLQSSCLSIPRKILHVHHIWTANGPSWGSPGLTFAPPVEEQIEDKRGTFALGASCQRQERSGLAWLSCSCHGFMEVWMEMHGLEPIPCVWLGLGKAEPVFEAGS